MSFRRIFNAVSPVGFGISAGAFIMSAVLKLMQTLYPSMDDLPMLTGLTWFHAMIGLSSFTAGLAAAWFRGWSTREIDLRKDVSVYALAVAGGWFIVLTCALWQLTLLNRPLFLLDISLILLAWILAKRMFQQK